ncbi:hypothetical protein M2451_003438 [Dysgonomonas sp. PFB1-18]|uniref:hypothetical protein n=1 Tax=unclassified Dysgonomonas TaxID=2630389 RepID=UPI002474282F|nr:MULTISPECIES: hypothetical protein [unclassified Dysgonomonas]MDH6310643.1 hypothetical protein [Dysgonomonas sp. PF1-14]MDH6340494.1 hypothetical protein [Dysgonomonas sp. PF1-16]MDH6382098.1 hypothetical protein [Dysgonomonas sp. PFB1-18]MDH6399442.1 hypothetical protein [Dysgonomonas sp. PF1-23]
MQARDIIGKTITDIYIRFEYEQDGLDRSACYLEIDNSFFVTIPYSDDDEILIEKPDNNTESLFQDKYLVETTYHVNKDGKTIKEIADRRREEKRAFFRRIGKHLGTMIGQESLPKEYRPHKTETVLNKVSEVRNTKITDFIWEPNEEPYIKGLFLLSNGFLITETTTAPSGTGLAGLNYFENIETLVTSGRYDYAELKRITYNIP